MMYDQSQPETTQRRFDLLLPTTKRGLHRKGISDDSAVATLTDRELRLLSYIGPLGRADIRRHFPNPQLGEAVQSAKGVHSPATLLQPTN